MTDTLLKRITPHSVEPKFNTKVSIIGAGAAGSATAFALMESVGEIALVDINANLVAGEAMDLIQGEQFLHKCKITGSTNYDITAHSDIVVITAGARPSQTDSKETIILKNVEAYKTIIPQVVKHSPHCVLLIVSFPVDIMTCVAAKLSGFPTNRVLGLGTMLDSARFRYLLGQRLNVSANSVHAYIIGELGPKSIPVWSNINVAGVQLASVHPRMGQPDDPEKWYELHQTVIKSTDEVLRLKNANNWSLALACESICSAILHNLHVVYPLSTAAKSLYGIEQDVYMSFPCLLTSAGASHAVPQHLSPDEIRKLKESAAELASTLKKLKF